VYSKKHGRKGAPECLHFDGGLEHKENVGVIVGVECFAFRAKVLGAVGTSVPLSDDAYHVPIAKRKGMRKVTKVG
jgi:hypothetical protein